MRTYTQQVRDHTSAMARIQDQYFATLKRAEAQYFDGVKRITEEVMRETEPVAEAAGKAEAQATAAE
jgi:hypothetical protein